MKMTIEEFPYFEVPSQGITRPGAPPFSAPMMRETIRQMQFEGYPFTPDNIIDGWSPFGYPQEYILGFKIPDQNCINLFLASLTDEEKINRVVTESNNKGTIVHLSRQGSLIQINWAEPKKVPLDYLSQGYAHTFWNFYGPNTIQKYRASLLAKELSVEVSKRKDKDMIAILGYGVEIERPTSGLFGLKRN